MLNRISGSAYDGINCRHNINGSGSYYPDSFTLFLQDNKLYDLILIPVK